MAVNQTSVQDQNSVQIGSAAMYFSTDNGGSFTNLGVGDSFAYTEEITPLDAEPDNGVAPERADGIASQKVTVTGNLWENNLTKIAALRGGIDVLSTVAGTPVAGASQVIALGDWGYSIPFELEGNNASGAVQTITSVTGSVDGLLTTLTDYSSVKNESSKRWELMVIDSGNLTTEGQTLTVVYSYTPAASTKVSTGGLTAASRVWMRFINRTVGKADAAVAAELTIAVGANFYDTVQYDFYYCIVNVGDSVTFKNKDDASPVIAFPVSVEGENSPTRDAGDQLYAKTKFNELIA